MHDGTTGESFPQLQNHANRFDSIYFNTDTPFCARLSCGGTIDLCVEVASRRLRNGMAIVRPPGHHAESDEVSQKGFCIYNNVVVAAKRVLELKLARRIMIVDWDVHHGNGIQRAFFDDPNVLYVSLHRYEDGEFYPGTEEGAHDQVGEGKGVGRNLNIPWPCAGMTSADYVLAFEKLVIPIGREFAPDLVIVSAGFDAAEGDYLGECKVTPACYGWMTNMLSTLADGHVALILEVGQGQPLAYQS
ncbi:hypothetical protein THASP1DRAFT_16759 [Thamnocephalis sphaerospora]|uniref:histone deacetylase n=1 Tax=Thamnocephalis sphaerospora TaxID=78915 RepID=A0A4P9XNS7_9FUNG|nr:hypothetical protein THASP1DRAFT_16759 [Thamnocephalis sphaerospora]|eukprot:RKP07643.1 hypothetical protein THASP1DRAFT_16759 [Thamnocephalis sphaerospora]